MAAKVVDICECLKDHLNSLQLSQTFTAIRENVWMDELADANGIQVVIVPLERELSSGTRSGTGKIDRRYRINIVVQRRFTTATTKTEQDEMLLLVEELENSIYGVSQNGYAFEQFNGATATTPIVDVEPAGSLRVFRSIIQVDYKGN